MRDKTGMFPVPITVCASNRTISSRSQNWEILYRPNNARYNALYADDLLMFLTNAEESLMGVQDLLRKFGVDSGLRVNWTKTCLFPVTQSRRNPDQISDIRWERQCLLYLGTHIYHKHEDILEGNINRASRGIKGNIAFWSTLPLSVAGRVALLKMAGLPRLLYYFRTLPVWIPSSLFKQLRSLEWEFLWGSGRRRIALATMMQPRAEGGWAVPDFEQYYLAAQLQWLTQSVANEFRGPDTTEGRWIPRHVLSFIILGQKLWQRTLTQEERTLQQCWNRSHKRNKILMHLRSRLALAQHFHMEVIGPRLLDGKSRGCT